MRSMQCARAAVERFLPGASCALRVPSSPGPHQASGPVKPARRRLRYTAAKSDLAWSGHRVSPDASHNGCPRRSSERHSTLQACAPPDFDACLVAWIPACCGESGPSARRFAFRRQRPEIGARSSMAGWSANRSAARQVRDPSKANRRLGIQKDARGCRPGSCAAARHPAPNRAAGRASPHSRAAGWRQGAAELDAYAQRSGWPAASACASALDSAVHALSNL